MAFYSSVTEDFGGCVFGLHLCSNFLSRRSTYLECFGHILDQFLFWPLLPVHMCIYFSVYCVQVKCVSP